MFSEYNIIRQGDRDRHTRQKTLAVQLMADAGLQQHQGPCTLANLDQLRATPTLQGYRIQVKFFT